MTEPTNTGDFVIRFFGSNDHAWVGHANIVAWTENDHTSRFAANPNKKPAFKRAIDAALVASEKRKIERVRWRFDPVPLT